MKYLLALFAFLLLSIAPSFASATRIQAPTATSGNSTSPSITFGSATTVGNFLVIGLEVLANGETITPPAGFSFAVSNIDTSGSGNPIYLYYAPVASSVTTLTMGLSVSTNWIMFAAEYSGIPGTLPLDKTSSGIAVSGSCPSGTVTVASANDLFIAMFGVFALDTYGTPTNGFSLVHQLQFGTSSTAAYVDLTGGTASGAHSTAGNNTSGGNGIIASFFSSLVSQSSGSSLLMGN